MWLLLLTQPPFFKTEHRLVIGEVLDFIKPDLELLY